VQASSKSTSDKSANQRAIRNWGLHTYRGRSLEELRADNAQLHSKNLIHGNVLVRVKLFSLYVLALMTASCDVRRASETGSEGAIKCLRALRKSSLLVFHRRRPFV
jgi:hypothetical protein